MSLNFEDGIPIATVYNKNNYPIKNVFYKDKNDDESESEDDDDENNLTKIRMNDPNLHFFPHIKSYKDADEQVDRCYITGETGSGKSTFVKAYVQKFMKKFPKAKMYLFSSKDEDKQLDSIKSIERVKVDDDILTNPYNLKELTMGKKPTLVIFDDIEDFKNAKINKEVARLRDEILRNGRSYGIYCLYCNHNPCDYKNTRNQIFESNKIIIFPKRAGDGSYTYLLEKKLNLSKDTIKKISSLNSSFVCINKNIPKSIISDKYIFLV